MFIVTGGSGFIGSNIVAKLNSLGISDILIVDNLFDGTKIHNLSDLNIKDYIDKRTFLEKIINSTDFGNVDAIFHMGACSSTSEWNGEYMMHNNFEYSKTLLTWCQTNKVPFIYASSASVYGYGKNGFNENRVSEFPINVYAYSKFQFDQYVRYVRDKLVSQVVGLRYFNVYGPRETHKGNMSSVILHFNKQVIENRKVYLFEGINGCFNGEQQRDFVHVDDCAKINLWFYNNPNISGIFNVGTGNARSYNEIAKLVLDWHSYQGNIGEIEYIPFPDSLKNSYQNYTQADLTNLRLAGYKSEFCDIEKGVISYLDYLNK